VFADAERIVSKQKLIPHTNKRGCGQGKLHPPAIPNPSPVPKKALVLA